MSAEKSGQPVKGTSLCYPLGYKPELDGLRAVAVMSVLLMHGGMPGFHWGYIGVDLFFVLSGYLITSILLREQLRTGQISLLSFYQRRALRLFPALAVLCIVFLAYAFFVLRDPTQGLREIVVVALYLSNWTRAAGLNFPEWLGHTWSLAIEEQFYLLWPLVLLAISAARRPIPLLLAVAGAIVAVSCWRLTLVMHGASTDRLYNGTDTRADALLMGVALALA